jgi:hypothetical protein
MRILRRSSRVFSSIFAVSDWNEQAVAASTTDSGSVRSGTALQQMFSSIAVEVSKTLGS